MLTGNCCHCGDETQIQTISENADCGCMTWEFTPGMLDDIGRDVAMARLRYGFGFEESLQRHTVNVTKSHDVTRIREHAETLIRLELAGHIETLRP